jgi:hypothetical protein
MGEFMINQVRTKNPSASSFVSLFAMTSFVLSAFILSACGPMNTPSAGGAGSASVGAVDAAKDLNTSNNSYLISVKFLGTLQAGLLPEGTDQFQIRILHPDLSPLLATESVMVDFYKVAVGNPLSQTPPDPQISHATLQTQSDGSVIASMALMHASKQKVMRVTVTNSAEGNQTDTKYVAYGIN